MKKIAVLFLCAVLAASACVKVDKSLGKGLVDKSLILDTYTVTFPLEEICMRPSEALSGYSDTRMVIGAIRDETFGLATREAAFTLVPLSDTLDLGDNPVAVSFTLQFARDSISCASDDQARILQNIVVNELSAPLPDEDTRNTQELPHHDEMITDGNPVYNGEGTLKFKFTQKFAQKYVDVIKRLGPNFYDREEGKALVEFKTYTEELPGIYISVDEPFGEGGRFNLFDFSCLSVSNGYYYVNENIGSLTVHSTWKGVEKDSTFIFIPGEMDYIDEYTYVKNNTKFTQYCFNRTSQSTQEGPATEHILVEGGGGLKPVIVAKELREKTRAAIAEYGGNPDKGIILKASIVLPFKLPDDYEELKYFPPMLSPTICITSESDTGVTRYNFAGLTDASVSTENQGNINRSILEYAPDITYHLQEILDRSDLDTATDADIWLLTIFSEQVANTTSTADSEYYQSLLYASYYNSIYGGYGYGGYGYSSYGYGGGYGNYYNYMMLAAMMASSGTSYTTNTELDKDRFYKAILNGTDDPDNPPTFTITFAIPQG